MKRKLLILTVIMILAGIYLVFLIKPVHAPDTITPTEEAAYEQLRLDLVTYYIQNAGINDPEVIDAMQIVPRHKFVPGDYTDMAYEDRALPIGYGQTISQPYIVAWMTDELDLKAGDKVLEIGTGSGYQAAVLAEMGFVDIYSIEIVPELAMRATNILKELGYSQIHLKQGDGYYGWPEQAPFNAIIVTAAPDHLPAPLVAQLAEDGRLIIPIGPQGWYQTLWKFVKQNGELHAYSLGNVTFVPFTGKGIEQDPGTSAP